MEGTIGAASRAWYRGSIDSFRAGPLVVVVEFKVGAVEFLGAALDQVWDYAPDPELRPPAEHRFPE